MHYRYLAHGKGFFIVSAKLLHHREEGINWEMRLENEFLNFLSFIKYKKKPLLKWPDTHCYYSSSPLHKVFIITYLK
jgi:hypothetical protein